MFNACQSMSEMSRMIRAQHEFPTVTVSRTGPRKVWTDALAGLRIGTRWQPDTSRSGPARGKHGHEADGPATNPGRTRVMTVRVLVVDDEPDVEALFRQQFRREVREGHYLLDFALSAEAALAMLDDAIGEEIILLVSDINMPGMSGLDLLPIVKTRRPDLLVFMISAYGDAVTVSTALARCADEFFTKPVDFPRLKQAIMEVMADATGGNG
jgi:CheY-like chemotaxis protein